MATDLSFIRAGRHAESPLPLGRWRVDPSRSSASFTARLAGRRVQGHLPLTGGAIVTPSIEDSTAELVARTEGVSTGHDVLDGLLASPVFLDAEAFPQIAFRSDLLVQVPTGWRAVGELQVKETAHPLSCELDVDVRVPRSGAVELTLTTRWVLDSMWITTQRVPALSRRIAMTCSVALDHTGAPSPQSPVPAA